MQTRLVCLLLFGESPLVAQGVQPASSSEAQSRKLVSVHSLGVCPSVSDVERELKPLLTQWVVAGKNQTAVLRVQLDDLGESFRISVQGENREIESSPPDCQERARVAAVVIAMQLETPSGSVALPENERPDQASNERSDSPERPDSRERAWALGSSVGSRPSLVWEIQGSLFVAGGFDEIAPVGLGPRMGLQVTRGGWFVRLSAGLVFFPPVDVDILSLSYLRVPTDLAFGRVFKAGAWSFSPSLAAAVDPFRVEARDIKAAQGETRVDVGTRLSLQISPDWRPLRPFIELQAAWFPRNFEIYASPAGDFASTPHYWWGVSLGGCFTLGDP